jgi:hypothetical protein
MEEDKELDETGFKHEMVVEFRRVGGKLIGRYKNGAKTGKYILPNRTEDTSKIIEGMPYRCVIKETDTGADFAKIISRVFIPRILVKNGFVLLTVEKKQKIEHEAYGSIKEAIQILLDRGIHEWMTAIQLEDFKDNETDELALPRASDIVD